MHQINEDNFETTDPVKLLDPKRYVEIEDMVVSVMSAQAPDYARDFSLLFVDKLQKVAQQLGPDMLLKYTRLLKALQLSGLRAMLDKDKDVFFQERILDVFWLEFADVKGEVEADFKAYFESPQIIEEWRKEFIYSFEKNIQKLGAKPIQVLLNGIEKQAPPTVQNWLADYNSARHVDPKLQKRSGFDQVSYMDHSKNVALLAKEEKVVLQKLLQFYDWLRFDPLRYDFSLPGQTKDQDEMVNVEKEEDVLSPELVAALEKMRNNSQPKKINDYMAAQELRLPANLPQPAELPKPAVRQNAPPVIPASPTPRSLMDIKTEIENKRLKAQEEIDRKLEELKRKVQK